MLIQAMATPMQPLEDLRNSDTTSSLGCETATSTSEDFIEPPLPRSTPRRLACHLPLRTNFKNFSSVVRIVVGNGEAKGQPKAEYLVHKELCAAASPFFAAAMNGHFTESARQSVHLPEEKPEMFEWFLQWLYTGSLTVPVLDNPSMCASDPNIHSDGDLRNSAGSPKFFLLLDLWALTDRLLALPFCNLVVSTIAQLAETSNSVPTPSDTWVLYDHIPEHAAGLRNLILDLFAYKKTDRLLEMHKDDWHPRFQRDLIVKLKRPGREAVLRHSLVDWVAATWPAIKACESCRQLTRPLEVVQRCCRCDKVFCPVCLKRHGDESGWAMPHDMYGCKPWASTSLCQLYHEHEIMGIPER